MFNKILASVGIGSAKVDTILDSSEVVAGESLTGKVLIKGGNIAQRIDGVEFELFTKVEREVNDENSIVYKTIEKYRVAESFELQPNEEISFDLVLDIPEFTPITIDRNFIWLKTSLDIDNAIDPSDKDAIKVLPTEAVVEIINLFEELGFRLNEIDIEESNIFNFGFVQEFEFKPYHSHFHLDEVELIFLQEKSKLIVYIQKERSNNGFVGRLLEATRFDESWFKLEIDTNSGRSEVDREVIKSELIKILG